MTKITNVAVQEIFNRFEEREPTPQSELEHQDPFTLLVAVVLSAQATDVGVNRATRTLFPVADTPEKMVALGEDGLKEYIKTIGLFNTKAKNVIALSRTLLDEHNGEVPRDRKTLESLPGVGRKTAAVVMNVAFGEPTLAVDTHVFRVSNRLGLVVTPSPEKTEEPLTARLKKLLPPGQMRHAHHWLILHGRYVCKARKPECGRCLINDLCGFEGKTCSPPGSAIALSGTS